MSDANEIFDAEYVRESATTTVQKKEEYEVDQEKINVVLKDEDIKKYGIGKPYKKEIIGRITYDKD